MPRTKAGTPLRPSRKEYVLRQLEYLTDLEDVDPEGLSLARTALSDELLSDEEVDDDEFHLSEEYLRRRSI